MDRITMDILKQAFLDRHSGWCVSLFMPTHRAGWGMEQGPIRFKNLLREAEERLTAKGLRAPEVQELLKEAQRLLQDRGFWRRQSDGLAVFFSADTLHFFRLPMVFKELAVVSHRFHVKPLLPILAGDGPFHILALSQNQIRLLEGTTAYGGRNRAGCYSPKPLRSLSGGIHREAIAVSYGHAIGNRKPRGNVPWA